MTRATEKGYRSFIYPRRGHAGYGCASVASALFRSGKVHRSDAKGASVMTKPTVAAKVVETLAQAGVRRTAGVVGDSLNSIVDEVRRNDSIEWIHVRNEEAGAFAAGAEAQLDGQLAVCAGSCGPGSVHLINGLYDCHRSMAPVLGIASIFPAAR